MPKAKMNSTITGSTQVRYCLLYTSRSFGSYPHADGIQVFPIRAGEELARDLEIEPEIGRAHV